MNVQVTMNVSLAVSNLLTFLGGALIVWLLWHRDHRRRAKAVNYLRSAIHNLVCDRRKNSLVENVISGIERGKLPAQRDFELLDKVVRSALGVYHAPGFRRLWQKEYRQRAFEAWMDEDTGERLWKEEVEQ